MSIESLPPGGERNHFNLLRLAAASAVIISHAFGLALGPGMPDPLERLTGFDLGTTAVIAFFAISGYFISLSFDRRHSNLAFIVARVTRIMPGLLVASLVAAFILGPLFTELPLGFYFHESAVWLYTPLNLALYPAIEGLGLPGVFAHNPVPNRVDGSIWTLFFEVACYVGLFVSGVAGFLRSDRFPWLLAAWLIVYVVAQHGPWANDLQYFVLFSPPFLLGMTAYRYRSSAFLNGWVALGLSVLALGSAVIGYGVQELWSVATGYGVLFLGFARAPALLAYNRVGDFSYGTYIYGFAVEQAVVAARPGIGPFALMAVSLPIAILLGAMSWFCVERPALEIRKMIGSERPALAKAG
jgi:peptidoglycan/LPS O-acetylase OafA/YrhL